MAEADRRWINSTVIIFWTKKYRQKSERVLDMMQQKFIEYQERFDLLDTLKVEESLKA